MRIILRALNSGEGCYGAAWATAHSRHVGSQRDCRLVIHVLVAASGAGKEGENGQSFSCDGSCAGIRPSVSTCTP